MKALKRTAQVVAFALLASALLIRLIAGGGRRLDDVSTEPFLAAENIEKVADVGYPPGNIAVSADGRIFFTLHPDGGPPAKVMELIDGTPTPYPSEEYQNETEGIPWFQAVLSVRIDRRGRLWVLDFARYGRGQPRLVAFDLATDELVHEYEFPEEIAGLGSMLNDLQIGPEGRFVYIAETSPFFQTPALIVYDSETKSSRRLLEGHPSVAADDFIIQTPGRDMRIFGLLTMRIAVDSIVLDTEGEWLYYGAVNADRLYRIKTEDLRNTELSASELAERVEDFAAKSLSDGLSIDLNGAIYLTDMENSAVHRIHKDGTLETVVSDPVLRWPDGLSFGPDGWLYLTCSSLHKVLFLPGSVTRANAPYQIYRFRPGVAGIAGH